MRRALKGFGSYEAGLLGLLVLLMIGFGLADPAFLSLGAQLDLSGPLWESLLLAVPMTLIVVTGAIDLSVGAAVSLCAVCFGLMFQSTGSVLTSGMVSLGVGVLVGTVNGLLVSLINIHSLVVTLATMALGFGIAEGASRGQPFSGFGPTLNPVAKWAVVFAFGAAVWTAVWTRRSVTGQSLYVIGLNETAAEYSGYPVKRSKVALFVVQGLMAGLVAVIYAARRGSVKSDIGQGLELDVVTAVVLGGTSVFGGRGSVWGTVLGALLVHEVRQFASWHWERNELIPLLIGGLLLISVTAGRVIDGIKTPQ
ncbi:MAG: ABC transporter permease [Chthonomonadaceae bacterium]|nr:ABC transporter permease [Chthonomonadaceae bacterium]